jgi:hypothetical protein
MKNAECRNSASARWVLIFFFILHSAFCLSVSRAAEDFGDVSVEPHAMFTGNTFHGYAEMRVALENHSHVKPHTVTISYPHSAYNNGNSLSRLARTVKLQPDAREIVSLLQPPLPAQGDGQLVVEVDGRREGETRVPNANNHCSSGYGYGRNNFVPTVLVSRSLDFDAVGRVFNAGKGGAFTAAMATGAPDAAGGGYQPNAWMPDARRSGTVNWLEVSYANPEFTEHLVIYSPMSVTTAGTFTLIGTSGTNLATVPLGSGRTVSRSGGWANEFSFPATSEPVKSVKLDFGKAPPYNLAVDAVEITGTNGSHWATDAVASSDNNASATTYAPGANAEVIATLRAESPVVEWSENWLAYTPFDAIVISPADLNVLPPGVANALTDYLYAGGNIFVAGGRQLPAAWLAGSSKKQADSSLTDVGFGNVFAAEQFTHLNQASVQKLREVVRENARYWQTLPSDADGANSVLPVVENLKIPTRGIVVIMLAFIIIIGPVNIILLNRRGRRTWMLWTIPAISFATTLLVFAYSLLREGITPDTRIAGVTVLDQAAHRAATIGAEGFYCPLTPSGGLKFESGTEATPLVATGYGSGASREVDWTQSQHLTRGWISARVPAHFHVRKSEIRRERIQVLNESGRLEIVNSLGAPIKSFWYADANLKIFETRGLPAGQKGGLLAATLEETPAKQTGCDGLLTDIGFATHIDTLNPGRYLLPNTYIAVLEGNPFIENALGTASVPQRTKSSAVVFGILEASEAK